MINSQLEVRGATEGQDLLGWEAFLLGRFSLKWRI